MHKHSNTNEDIIQLQWKNKSRTGNIYKKINQDKVDLGRAECKMRKLIKHNIYIVTVTNVKTSLVSVVNP